MITNTCRESVPGCPEPDPYKHQIDLYWETEDSLARYVNIANAKWRSHEFIHLHEVLLLHRSEKVAAHKAFMITNSGYTGRAKQAAWDEGISLLIVRPQFDTRSRHPTRRPLILEQIQEKPAGKTTPIYRYKVHQKQCGMVTPETREWHHPAVARPMLTQFTRSSEH